MTGENFQGMSIQHFLLNRPFSAFYTQSSLAQTEIIECLFFSYNPSCYTRRSEYTESRQGGPKFHDSIIPCGLPKV